ncbi:MAG: hypothetical protein AAB340_03025 [Patescibacteria group bacterium]
MEGGLIGQLGINWKLLLSQAVNFFILLLILRAFVYKPLLAVIKKRNEKIREGLEKAQIADVRLKEIDNIGKNKIREAEQQSILMIENAKQNTKIIEQTLSRKAEMRHEELMGQLEHQYQLEKEEIREEVIAGAGDLVKKILVKTVQLNPGAVDDALIEKAVSQVNKEA